MPSSTFSSDALPVHELEAEGRLVSGGWGRTFVAAAVVALAALGWWEGRWRSRGVEPSISSVGASWHVARDRIGGRSIALVGTSKMQSAIDPWVLGEALGREPAIQLALIDRSPLPILEQMADDSSFAGTVVVDIAPRIFFDGTGGREAAARELLDSYATYRTSPGDRANARMELIVEGSLVLRRPAFSIRRLLDSKLQERELRLPFARVRPDRFRELDFERVNLESRRLSQATIVATSGRAASEDELESLVGRTSRAAAEIRRRGGEVVLTLLPVSGRARKEEERRFPRFVYWDVLAAGTGLPSIHFEDFDDLARFDCADGLHLGREQAAAFTRAFAAHLLTLLPERVARPPRRSW